MRFVARGESNSSHVSVTNENSAEFFKYKGNQIEILP